MGFTDLARKQFSHGLILHYGGFNQNGFDRKLMEIQREIQQLQAAYHRLRHANRQDYNRGFLSPVKGDNTIHVVSEKVEAEIASLHGWILSLVESVFTLVRLECGQQDVATLRSQWRSYF